MLPSRSKEEVVHEFRIQSLQEAAMRVIARKGMTAATMQDIAEEAGVAKGTIYLYFKDRDELVEKTFESAVTELHGRMDEALESDAPLEERLRRSLHRLFEFFRENREFFRLYISHRFPEGDPQQRRRQHRQCERYRERTVKLAGVLEEAMDRGEIRRMDPLRLAMFLAEGTNAIVIERVMDETPQEPETDAEMIVSTFLDGVRTKRS
ncbi:MAG TPA: helix-turn-helix domain-containing protein [Thermoanaerobaculia bacterium]|nr:helix-turn-helix domain-containing protein [Thermoanaerobaculia bacterium]